MIKQFINKLINTNKVNIMKEGTVKFFNSSKDLVLLKSTIQRKRYLFIHLILTKTLEKMTSKV